MTSLSFAQVQIARVRLRWHILSRGIMAGVFWTLFLGLWSLAASAGFDAIGWALLGMYCVAMAPLLILQILLVADLLAYVVIGKIFAWPTLIAVTKEWIKQHPQLATPRKRAHVLVWLADCSPLSSLAIWSMTVLSRMPQSAHAEVTVHTLSTVRLQRREIQMECAVYDQAVRRLRIA